MGELTGYARCSTTRQDLTAQCAELAALGVPGDRIYTDPGLTGTNRSRPGLDQALASVRAGDTFITPRAPPRSITDQDLLQDFSRGPRKAKLGAVSSPKHWP